MQAEQVGADDPDRLHQRVHRRRLHERNPSSRSAFDSASDSGTSSGSQRRSAGAVSSRVGRTTRTRPGQTLPELNRGVRGEDLDPLDLGCSIAATSSGSKPSNAARSPARRARWTRSATHADTHRKRLSPRESERSGSNSRRGVTPKMLAAKHDVSKARLRTGRPVACRPRKSASHLLADKTGRCPRTSERCSIPGLS